MQVDLNKLKTFYTLAKTESYTGCAQRLHQPCPEGYSLH